MRALSAKRSYRSVENKKVEAASDKDRIMMLYIAMKERVGEMRHVIKKAELSPADYQALKDKNVKIRSICDFLINAIYLDGECQSDGFDRLYHYIKGNTALAFSSLEIEALDRSEMAIDELIDIWKATGG